MALGWRGQYYKYREFSLNLLAIYKQRPDVKAFLEIILSLSTLIIFILFALKPTALTMISLFNEIKEKRATLDSLNQKINDLQTANRVYAGNQTVISDIDSSIFTAPEPQTISKQILGMALKNSIDILGISLGQVALVGKVVTTPGAAVSDLKPLPSPALSMQMSISAKGTYENLYSFIKDLENLKIPIKFDGITLNSSSTPGSNAIVILLNGRVPYLGQK